ncbi:MAG TPA: inositol monophosphatase family protein [Candidatus Saccharimonadia bacterium]|nr:inositol monophosphatase family protein [Candidatus Saccharimonadia bacterium]
MDDVDLDAALVVAMQAADAAEAVIARYYRRSVAVEHKPDESPVTIADRDAELEIRRVLEARYPAHGYYGEEYGRSAGASDYLWLIDPIDGTKSFVRNYPFFSTQIALMQRDALVLGVSSARQFGEVAWARRGGGAWLDGEPIRVSACTALADAAISFGNLKTLARSPRWQRLAALVQGANRTRGYGDFYHYHLLARGSIDVVLESDVNILDIAALVVIVREAGGVFTDLEGGDVTLGTTSVLAASTPALHRVVLDALR